MTGQIRHLLRRKVLSNMYIAHARRASWCGRYARLRGMEAVVVTEKRLIVHEVCVCVRACVRACV